MNRRPHHTLAAIGVTYSHVPYAEDVEWQLRGVCRSGKYDPDLWSPTENHEENAEKAKDICLDCPVMVQCAQWALDVHEKFGVWGGMSEGDREMIWNGRRKRRRYHRKTMQELGVTA